MWVGCWVMGDDYRLFSSLEEEVGAMEELVGRGQEEAQQWMSQGYSPISGLVTNIHQHLPPLIVPLQGPAAFV